MKGQNFASQVLSRHTFRISRKKGSDFFYHRGTLNMTTGSGHVITSGQPFTGNVNLKVSNDKTGSTVRVKDLNLPSSSTPFKNAPMAPR